ncbi:hypothetical protein CP10139811_0349 [Chlamydia ibidis]|uniref:IncA family protein n=2 Tax=Chlamydia ibidis TaxID=1405396 RepID=S7J2X7_9CHLA|nr:hypothetical protein [Chlamydia ibidis]EPP34377.1 hypothetical protein CP10139811_0349 [Chlamydia ibidis]EQM62847.1 hypothetical protein H359_0406 [Chlamydia ibidis 10-1398/6]
MSATTTNMIPPQILDSTRNTTENKLSNNTSPEDSLTAKIISKCALVILTVLFVTMLSGFIAGFFSPLGLYIGIGCVPTIATILCSASLLLSYIRKCQIENNQNKKNSEINSENQNINNRPNIRKTRQTEKNHRPSTHNLSLQKANSNREAGIAKARKKMIRKKQSSTSQEVSLTDTSTYTTTSESSSASEDESHSKIQNAYCWRQS